jgi:hypothetical protein
LLSPNYERSQHFGPVVADLPRLGRHIVLDGDRSPFPTSAASPLDHLSAAMQRREASRVAYVAFDSCTSTAATCAATRCSSTRRSWAELLRSAGCARLLCVDLVLLLAVVA